MGGGTGRKRARVNWVDPGDMNTAMHRAADEQTLLSGLIQQMSLKFYLLGFRRIGRERAKIPGSVRQLGCYRTGVRVFLTLTPDP